MDISSLLAPIVTTFGSSMVMVYEDSIVFKGGAEYFLTKRDGHNCGPIVCLKFMEIYDFIDMDIIDENREKWKFLPPARLQTAYVFGVFEG